MARFFIYFVLTGIIGLKLVSGDCNRNYGPVGTPECVLLYPYYSKYQWATCLTNKYIQTVSKGNAICRDHTATYCYYQCMMELYEIAEGHVCNDCACGVDAPQQTQTPPTNQTQLPNHCYSPSGGDCSWYSDCLERRFPCQEMQQTSYAINYGLKFCNLYEEHYQSFSTEGQQWIDAVRGCLQVALVPLLRPFLTITCGEIKEKAFNSHLGCYTNPIKNAPSFCDLSFMDKWRIFYTVIPGLMSNCYRTRHLCKDIFLSAKQLLNVRNACKDRETILSEERKIQQIQIRYIGLNRQTRSRRSLQSTDDFSAGADLVKAIANKMGWHIKGVKWVAYFQNNLTADESMQYSRRYYLNILLAPSKLYNLNDRRNTSAYINITSVVEETTHAFRNGNLRSDMITDISLVKFAVCADYNCSNTTIEIEPSAGQKDIDEGVWSLTNRIFTAIGSSLLLIIVAFVIICMKRRNSSKNCLKVIISKQRDTQTLVNNMN
ncbi:uncharacterized protein LOC133173407 [Saccostrea echinata]|uniref:uncharacterized protein LOC133173407 n=1 Tax=Saccostrea echinata TaxID=191078 RepID=UPI002A82565D|nr:uncharacterized protein LOC133173407 [Saccostrea echinata]